MLSECKPERRDKVSANAEISLSRMMDVNASLSEEWWFRKTQRKNEDEDDDRDTGSWDRASTVWAWKFCHLRLVLANKQAISISYNNVALSWHRIS